LALHQIIPKITSRMITISKMQFNYLVKSTSLRQKSLCQKHDTKSLCQQPKAIMIKSQLVVKTTNGVLILVDKV
jgi:hypothetical protein